MSNLEKAVSAIESVVGFETMKGIYAKDFTKYLVLAIADEIESRANARAAKASRDRGMCGPR